jgi:tetratricopeptide (TPR) repeat protein
MKKKKIYGFLLVFSLCAIIVNTSACNGKADADDVRLYVNAMELYGDGEFSQTAELLSGVKKFSPALTLRAKSEYFLGNLEQAEKSCIKAVKYQPAAFEAKLFLARILRDKGETEKSRQLTEDMLTDNPNDIRLLRFASILAVERGDAAEAAVLLDRAAELSADSAMVLLDRARLRWIAGRGTEALEDLSRAGAMLPRNTPVLRSVNQLEKSITEAIQ